MARRCTVCAHPQFEKINAALVQGASTVELAKDYPGLSEDALQRHRATHLPKALAKAQEAKEVAHGDDLIAELAKAIERVSLLSRDTALIAKGESKHLLIVIDSLQSWAETVSPDSGTEYETLNASLAALRHLAHTLRVPILFISERNRESMKSGGLNAGAGSRKIEYGAETVFDLDRDMNDMANGAGEFEITLKIAKNRHGSVGVQIPLLFNEALQQFREGDGKAKVNATSTRARM